MIASSIEEQEATQEAEMGNPNEPELLDHLMANGFVLEVFMLQMSLEIAQSKADPQAWTRAFVSQMHERVDGNEERVGAPGQRYPVHELARSRLDFLGRQLAHCLILPRDADQKQVR